jgi:imidazoleglycerol-phosphate dehydratase
MSRTATLSRTTSETDISVSLALEGTGAGERRTGIGFFDHMLDSLARHGGLDLDVEARGDLDTGAHHTVEDTGLVLGSALDEALEDRAGIARFGDATVPMDEARASAAIDLSGRPLCVFEARRLPRIVIGGFETELCEEFLRAVSSTSRMTLHVRIDAGRSAHHMVEAAFKAFARALRAAVAIDANVDASVPSTKGVL